MDDAFSLHLKWFRHCLSNSESLKISNKISRILHTKGRRRDFVPGQPDRTKPTRETIMKSWIGLAAIAGTHAGCKYWEEFHFRWSQIQHYWDRDGSPNSFLNSVMFHHLKWKPSYISFSRVFLSISLKTAILRKSFFDIPYDIFRKNFKICHCD